MYRAKIAAVAVLAFAGCGDDDDQGAQEAERICRSQHDAIVCLERDAEAQGGPWKLTADGFKPGSRLFQSLSGTDAPPAESVISDDGTFPSEGAAGGLVVPPGDKTTLTVKGTAEDGESVRMMISVEE